MSYPTPKELLARHGLEPKKAWGQNFLRDQTVLDRIVRATAPRPGETVLELGAGLGHLTRRLADTGAKVIAVERDRELVPILEAELSDAGVEVVAANAKTLDLGPLRAGGAPMAVVGNLPYHLTSPILFHLLDQRAHLSRLVVMVQKEVARRLAAAPGTKDYGVLSVRFQLFFEARSVFDVPPGAFLPPPRVTSTVIRLDRREAPLADPGDEAVFRAVVKGAFGQRRKTLSNALKAARLLSPEALAEALEAAGLDPGARAETVPVTDFAALSREVAARGGAGAGSEDDAPGA